MQTTWCPVRLFSTNVGLIELVRNPCLELGVSDLQTVDKLGIDRSQPSSLAQILLLDLHSGLSESEAEERITTALQRSPRDIVIGIGGGFLGSIVASWARRGMHGIIDYPVRNEDFKKALREANDSCIHLRLEQSELRLLSLQRDSISKREEEVLELVVQGVPNKSIASKLDVSQRTIEARRQKIYQKMNAKRLADLIRALDKLEFLTRSLKQLA